VQTASIQKGTIEAIFAGRILVSNLFHAAQEPLPQFKNTYVSDDPTGSWNRLTIDVDAVPVEFRSLYSGPFWVALRQYEDCLVSIEAHHVDPASVRLVQIVNRSRYLEDDGRPG
jgi:hypothetical protein